MTTAYLNRIATATPDTKATFDSLTFRHLVYIKAVAEAQNFTRAANSSISLSLL